MEKNLLNYKVTIEKEGEIYNAYCKTLGLADFGKTINEATSRITKLIKFHIESLSELGHKIPAEDKQPSQITTIVQVIPSAKTKLAFV